MQFLNQDCSRGSSYCKGECEWNYKSDECQTRVEQHRYIAIRDPFYPKNSQTIKGPYSNLTLAEKDIKEFEAIDGISMIIKTVDGIIQEDKSTIALVNAKTKKIFAKEMSRGYDESGVHVNNLIQGLKNNCKFVVDRIILENILTIKIVCSHILSEIEK